jgi:hypothetical protein
VSLSRREFFKGLLTVVAVSALPIVLKAEESFSINMRYIDGYEREVRRLFNKKSLMRKHVRLI